ncbi:hypothetical protein B0T10DRAFT_60217 [Thelonectria olida]|uniref:Uncharacterized protein n=1 Tax=Thelonectria olida TaxID=1576542 RepID=A0A9P8W3I5_9HYPO|nr:hypothetical protein B0T10DRAFT_60217 [Thelonectria olida]
MNQTDQEDPLPATPELAIHIHSWLVHVHPVSFVHWGGRRPECVERWSMATAGRRHDKGGGMDIHAVVGDSFPFPRGGRWALRLWKYRGSRYRQTAVQSLDTDAPVFSINEGRTSHSDGHWGNDAGSLRENMGVNRVNRRRSAHASPRDFASSTCYVSVQAAWKNGRVGVLALLVLLGVAFAFCR